MGYTFQVLQSDWLIPKENIEKAYLALRELIGHETINKDYVPNLQAKPHFSFVNPEEFETAPDLVSALKAWRYEVFEDEEGLSDPYLIGDKRSLGDDELLFSVLAPYVQNHSFIELIGLDDVKFWRWNFINGELIRVEGELVYK